MGTQSLDNLPPYNYEAEQSVLGACIHSPEAFYKAVEILIPEDFYKRAHKIIFYIFIEWFKTNECIDVLSIAERLNKANKLDDVGGREYLDKIEDYVPTSTAVTYHSKIVKDMSVRRTVIVMCENTLSAAYNQDLNGDELLEKVNSEALKLESPDSSGPVSYDFLMKDSLRRMEEPGARGINIGFPTVDSLTGGIYPGESIILAARPGMGKTSFALDISENVAREGHPVGFFSLEMSKEEIADKRISRTARINTAKIRKNNLYPDDHPRLHEAGKVLSPLPIYIDDQASLSLINIVSKAKRMKREFGIELLVIDYLHLMDCGNTKGGNRNDDLSHLSRGIKILAKDLKIPILLLCQLNRGCESRDDKRPELKDLRDSGAIEQDADMVWFIYRDVIYNPETENPKAAELIIRKQRHGPLGEAPLVFEDKMSSFSSA